MTGGAEGFPVANIVSNGGSGGDGGVDELCAFKGVPRRELESVGGSRRGEDEAK